MTEIKIILESIFLAVMIIVVVACGVAWFVSLLKEWRS
jgi:hypothetical protein